MDAGCESTKRLEYIYTLNITVHGIEISIRYQSLSNAGLEQGYHAVRLQINTDITPKNSQTNP